MIPFILFVIFIIYPLGRTILLQITDSNSQEITKSLVFGLLLISIIPYLLGAAGIYQYTQIILLVFSILSWILILKKAKFSFSNFNWLLLILTVFVVTLNSQILYPFGQITPKGISLYGAHYIDSTWHLALINSLLRSIPPENPVYAGVMLKNYHYFADLQMAVIHSFTSISIEKIFFVLMGPLYLLLASVSVYSFVYKSFNSKLIAVFSILLILCAGNWYYFSRLIYPAATVSPSVAWMDFYSSKIVNYPLLYSLSLSFVLLELIVSRPLKIRAAIILGVISGFMFMVKSHSTLIFLSSLFVLGILKAFQKEWSMIVISIIGIIVCLFLALSTLTNGSSVLLFSPMWFIKTMYESPFHLNTSDWELRRQFLLSIGAYLGVVKLYLQGLSFFLVINFGLGLVGVIYYIFKFFVSKDVEKLLVIIFTISLGLTLSFIYSKSATVTIQFIYTAYISSQILFLVFLNNHLTKKYVVLVSVLYWTSLLPGVNFINNQYKGSIGQYNIFPEISQALVYIHNLTPGIVLTSPEFWSGSYMPAYSSQRVYLSDLGTVEVFGINPDQRKQISNKILTCQQTVPLEISYLFTTNIYNCLDNQPTIQKIYSNSAVSIYRKNAPQ